jgi:integrase
LSRSEIAKLGKAMRAAEAAGEHPTGLAAIRLLLLTGFRRLEGLGLRRDWLNAEEAAVRLPDTKSGAQLRVIGRPAAQLLLAQPQRAKSSFFVPADWGEGHFIGIVRVLDRVCALAGLADVTPHTLRHTFASVAGDLGFSELTIAALLGHASRGVTQRYVHLDEALRMAADKVAGEIAAILDGAAGRSRADDRQPAASEPALEHAPA